MTPKYSIAEARAQFAALVHEVEADGAVQITRRGEVVAVLLSRREYERLSGAQGGFYRAVSEFRAAYNVSDLDINPEIFEVRPSETGREIDL
jgi:prevent-host-death family protein